MLCKSQDSYDLINIEEIEDNFFEWLSFDHTIRKYRRVDDYWKQKKAINELM